MRSIFAIMAVFASMTMFAGEINLSNANAEYLKLAPSHPCYQKMSICKEDPTNECCNLSPSGQLPMKPVDSSDAEKQ